MLNIRLKLNTTRVCQLNGSENLVYLIQLMNEILTVLQADYVNDYTLVIHFSNGEKRTFDFSSLFDRGHTAKVRKKRDYQINQPLFNLLRYLSDLRHIPLIIAEIVL